MTTQNDINIKNILNQIPANSVVTAQRLLSMGISHSLMRTYEQSGWLRRIGNGAYTRLNETADINGALYALQNDCQIKIHQGGMSALQNIYGKLHYVKNSDKVHLFCLPLTNLPAWFRNEYAGQYILHLTDFLPYTGFAEQDCNTFSLNVSTIERALLEMLYLVPKFITSKEAFEITETIQSIKPHLMEVLLMKCTSVKVKRLLLCFADIACLQWFDVIDKQKIALGSGNREIDHGGKLYSKYKLVIQDLEM